MTVYNVVVLLKYYTYDLHSDKKDSEFVMGLEQDIEWDECCFVEEPIPNTDKIFKKQENVHFHLTCGRDKEHDRMPEDFFSCEISNIVVHDKEEARSYIKPFLYNICRTLSFLISMHNCNKHSYQPRVEADMDHAVWSGTVYAPFDEAARDGSRDLVETRMFDGKEYQIITVEMPSIVVSENFYMKIYGNIPTDDFRLYIKCEDPDINFMLDEFYLALGKENVHSKFFHLFSIVEFVEKRYEAQSGAEKLFQKDEIDSILESIAGCSVLEDKDKRIRVSGLLRQMLTKMTDYGRTAKLVNILHNMNIFEIENCGTGFEINSKVIGDIIELRNRFYHGDRSGSSSNEDVELAVTRLMCICERIIKWGFSGK